MKLLFFMFNLFLLNPNLQAYWLEKKAEGWAWYEDLDRKTKKNPPEIEHPPETSSPKTFAEEVSIIKKNMEEKLARAVLVPSEENVADYMQEQKRWIDQAEEFSRSWAKILLQRPLMDTTLEHPVSQYGIQVQKQIQQENHKRLIYELIKNHGLFFFYEGQSKVSQAFAFVVQEFATKYGWKIVATSTDGFILEGFHNNQIDKGIVKHFSIEAFPSLFIVNPKTSVITPIAFGLVSLDQIENNIVLQFLGEGR